MNGRLALLLAVLLVGCVPPRSWPPEASLEAQARHWAKSGEPARAARAFETLAFRAQEPKRSIYLLYAAKGYFLARKVPKAKSLFALVHTPLPPPHDLEYRLLQADLALAEGHARHAREILAGIDPSRLTPSQRRTLERLKSRLAQRKVRKPPPGPPRRIALLLPWSSAWKAAQSIEKGLRAMQAFSQTKVHLLRIDSSADPTSAYFKADRLGVDLTIGPLLKPHVGQVAHVADGQPPVLALNRAVSSPPPGFYQFALLPEDEVEALTELAAREGGRRALIVVPDTPFGQRIGKAFQERWQRLGGEVAALVYYFPTAAEFSLYLQRLQESDLVFLAAKPEVALRLVLAIKNRRQVPIYALSQLYVGRLELARDAAFEGVVICDLPWLLKPSLPGYPPRENFNNHASGFQLRLIAFGMDAYRLATELIPARLRALDGATGRLSLLENGIVDRDPLCARFRGGFPKPIEGSTGRRSRPPLP